MQPAPFTLIADLIEDPSNGWSIGSFGAIGEFTRDAGEATTIHRTAGQIDVVTTRGAIRVRNTALTGVAWDTLSSDGETWGHVLAFCAPRPATGTRVLRFLGHDADAVRAEDRYDRLYDLGVASGCVAMAVRTRDPALIAALDAAEGQALLDVTGIMPIILSAQPHRVLLSPAGRIEVYQPIPASDGESPEGPHTHLLPNLIAKDRAHSSNTPIPDGWQAALSMHPRSPWRTPLGERHAFRPDIDAAFAPLLDHFGLDEDEVVARQIGASLDDEALSWPTGRRQRHKARIVLRRLHAAGDARVIRWRAVYDRCSD